MGYAWARVFSVSLYDDDDPFGKRIKEAVTVTIPYLSFIGFGLLVYWAALNFYWSTAVLIFIIVLVGQLGITLSILQSCMRK